MSKRQLLLLSSSRVHNYEFLEYAATDIKEFLGRHRVTRILFIPFALTDHDGYAARVRTAFDRWGYAVDAIHRTNAKDAIANAQAVFIGGGNTFLLLKALHERGLIDPIRQRVLHEGVPYMGASAGTNVATASIHTTNDMPIIFPPTFDALALVPFNINPHYVDPDPDSKHKGETREERILQYLEMAHSRTVLGMREGCTLLVQGNSATLLGLAKARLFMKGAEPKELDVGTDLSFLLNN